MNKKLLTQIKNEWRSNLWLVTELLLVSVVMWYIVDYMYVKAAVYYEPRGFDISHCYLIQMGRLTDKSPDFILIMGVTAVRRLDMTHFSRRDGLFDV